MQFNLIGAGRLGGNIAVSLVRSGLAQLVGVYSKNPSSAQLLVNTIGSGQVVKTLGECPQVSLTIITTSDQAIHSIATQLAEEKICPVGSIVMHCSGVLSSAALNPLKKLGCHLASLHPLKAFRAGRWDPTSFNGCDCVVEGDDAALTVLSSLFKPLGATFIPIHAEGKATYHAAAVIASNYVVTLAAAAVQLLQEVGVSTSTAQEMTTRLMASSLDNIRHASSVDGALTGPLTRGDIKTIELHLHALEKDTLIQALYRSAALATLPLTPLSNEVKSLLQDLLRQ